MESPRVVLAKRPPNGRTDHPGVTLVGHTGQVLTTFRHMFGTRDGPTRLGLMWLIFFGLPEERFVAFHAGGTAAVGLHDVGKANLGFQDAVMGKKNVQAIRHEHLSALLLDGHAYRDWLETIHPGLADIVISAIISHHLKAKDVDFPARPNPEIKYIRVLRDGLADTLELTSKAIGVPAPNCSNVPELWNLEDGLGFERVEELRDRLMKFRRRLRRDDVAPRLLMAVRSALIAADSGGSALVREEKDLRAWLNEAFDENRLIDGDYIDREVIAPRIRQIELNGQSYCPSSFQDATENLGDRALLLAPCGSGKTIAAWRWIKARLDRHPRRCAIFLYPTRGTSTEGFRDYVSWAPEADAALVHGTAGYELDGMFEDADDERAAKDYAPEERLYAVGYWSRRIFSATVHQFLGFMQNVYRSTCLLPLLADGIVVIDEVHSFDRNLFSALKLFLKNFNIPVLCMTASLPQTRIRDLEECGLEVFPQDPSMFSELKESADMPRYRVKIIEGPDEAKRIGEDNRRSGRRLLWVVNQVKRCQELSEEFGARCYHGRFKLEDRRERHAEVVGLFQQRGRGAFAVTTQVCEMSLDLDAEVLITEAAPITSLIQRMGRCNRHAKPGDGRIGEVYVYKPEKMTPYRPEELEGLDDFLGALNGQVIGQSLLRELLEQYGPKEVEVERYASFLECGPWAAAREESLVEEQDWTVQAILDEDIERYLVLRRDKKPADGLILPAPRHLARRDPRLDTFLHVAPSSHYTREYGLRDEPVEVVK
ncbi:MAG: CRISPR-associated helicase Cas3' [Pseudomonadota bacterium]